MSEFDIELARDCENMSHEIKKLQEQNKTLREALEFYAENFTTRGWGSPFWSLHDLIDESDIEETIMLPNLGIKICKGGKRAREALAKLNEKQGEG